MDRGRGGFNKGYRPRFETRDVSHTLELVTISSKLEFVFKFELYIS
jgi:hypothetical protein